MKNFRTNVFKRAYEIMKTTGKSFAVCLSKAWQLYTLSKLMKTKVVTFYYEKIDGSLRKASGTLNIDDYQAKTDRLQNPKVFNYYDVDAKSFRCFKVENLIKVNL
ncbi:SH3 beta-barrel fold-containing protein [Chryseobacterium sp.]|uniref:SH3 beta-barrel fold-containing protein n=1 Tax=Chryseobacterium sp. TaxID=1871047 RepID=UPI00289B3A27|nr:SH3 beta-barrel fold-containing protein [Chryseobacterium sp.]